MQLKLINEKKYHRLFYAFLILACLLIANMNVYAQGFQVTGVVNDENGESLPGVNVTVKGTTTGMATDMDGNFSITVPGADAVLVFSYIGYNPQEIPVGAQRRFTVTMTEMSSALSEIVVIGYGTQRRESVTGSVASIRGDAVRQVPSASISSSLQGRVAGVDMSQTSTRPGAEMQIRIRGTRSLNADNDPLVVLDGIPFMGRLSDINPSTIRSVDILKDASATAIYGSRGANGVILVTTDKGDPGRKATVSYSGYYGAKTLFSRFPMMNAKEYIAFKNAAQTNGSAYGINNIGVDEDASGNTDTDWQDLTFQTGMATNHDIGITGGGAANAYSFGAGYYKESTVLPGQEYGRFSLRGSLEQEISRFKFGLTTQNTYSLTDGNTNNPMYQVLTLSALASPYDAQGNLRQTVRLAGGDEYRNPLLLKDAGDSWIDRTKTFASYNNLYGEVKFFEGLKYRINIGLNYRKTDYGNFVGEGSPYSGLSAPSTAAVENSLQTNWAVENLLYYDKTFAQKHTVNAVAMYSAEKTEYNSTRMSATDIPANYMQFYNIGLAIGDKVINANNQTYWARGLMSYMGRVAYAYDNRYMLTATIRSDGSSVLAKGSQWHTYFAVSGGWNIKNESFMQDKMAIDILKLRVGYGETSNQAISPYATRGGLGVVYYNYGSSATANQYGYYVNTLPNNNLGWEFSRTTNIGIDFGFLNRFSGTLEYYVQNTRDILLQLNLPPTSGVDGSFWANIGKTQNKGLELSLNATIVQDNAGWNWDFGINIYGNRNKIVELASGVEKDEGNGWFKGYPIDVVFDYKKLGIWQTNDPMGDVTDYEGPNGKTGMIKVGYYGDYDSSGRPVRVIGADDRQILGSMEPKFQGGFNTRVSYKNVDLSIVGFFKSGGMLVSTLYGNSSYLNLLTGRRNNVKLDFWTPENPTNDAPGPNLIPSGDNVKYSSTLAYFDASFLKIRTISLGYNFESALLQKASIERARIYITAQNPFVMFSPYKNYSGMDPETNSPARENQASGYLQPSRQLAVAFNTPSTRSYLIGLNVTF